MLRRASRRRDRFVRTLAGRAGRAFLGCEPLEQRTLMAVINWDGGGDGTTLTQATNWAGHVLPGVSDDAVINIGASSPRSAPRTRSRSATRLPLAHVDVDLRPRRDGFVIEAHVRTEAKTGAEMEALHAVAVAALTVYDMVKAADKAMTIGGICLVRKAGGRSGEYRRRR